MQLKKTYVPYGGYWSTPFVKWQGNFANLHPIKFASEVASRALMEREIEPSKFDALHLGTTVPSQGAFYGAPWLAGAGSGARRHCGLPGFGKCAVNHSYQIAA